MDHNFAIKCQCSVMHTRNKKIVVAGGGELNTDQQIPQCEYDIQGEKFTNAFNLIPLKGYDVILGADWMFNFNPITLDLKERDLGITKEGRMVTLYDFTRPGKHFQVSNKKMVKMLRKGALGCVIYLNSIIESEESDDSIPTDVKELLQSFQEVLEEPKRLPPRRSCDHIIKLKSGTEPPNLRPYRVPHYQKGAMEEIIVDLIKSQEI